jgi:hypothetical protein
MGAPAFCAEALVNELVTKANAAAVAIAARRAERKIGIKLLTLCLLYCLTDPQGGPSARSGPAVTVGIK